MNINKVMLCGNLVQEPELRYTSKGKEVMKNTLAINYNSKKNNEVAFVSVVFWGKQAELVNEYCEKGSNLFVEGRLVTRSWEDKEGQRRSMLEVNAERINFVGGKK